MNELNRRRMLGLVGGGVAYGGLASVQAQTVPSPDPVLTARNASAATPPIRQIDLDGVQLAYRHHVGTPGRRPLVFVHGYALRGTGDIYAPLIARLTGEFDVYALDLRGHGASAHSIVNWSQEAIADDVAAFVDKLGLRGAVFAGHSLGGFTGLFAQIRHPGTFSALALLATAAAAGGSPPPGLRETWVTRGRDPAFTQGAFAAMYLRPGPNDIRQSVDAVGLVDPRVHEAFFSNFGRVVLTERLAEVRVPVLLVNGLKDTVVSPAEQHRTALGLPRSKEVAFSVQGHMLPIEAPDATAREMVNFFTHDVRDSSLAPGEEPK